MKKHLSFIGILGLAISCPAAILAQGSVSVSQVSAANIRTHYTLPTDSLALNPYCTVSLSVHNFEKLNSKDYRQGLRKLSSFTVNAHIRSRELKLSDATVPVFLVNFEKNKFTQISHQQAMLVNKLLLNTAAVDVPTVNVSTETVDRSSISTYVNILKSMNSVLQSMACPNGWLSATANTASAFSDLLNSISADNDSKGEWSFPILPADKFTRPYSYAMFILKPDNALLPVHQIFTIKGDEAYIGDCARFTKYPYILITTSFSDYLSEDQLPSSLSINQLDVLSLAQAKVKLYSMIGRISRAQFDAEENLLQRYNTYLDMKTLTDQVPAFKNPGELKSKAVDKYVSYKEIVSPDVYMLSKPAFASRVVQLDESVNAMANSLGYYSTVSEAVKMYTDCSMGINEKDLPHYQYYHNVMKEVPFLCNSYFYQNFCSRIQEEEQRIYEQHYALPLKNLYTILYSGKVNDRDKLSAAKQLYDSLATQRNGNLYCRSCNDSLEKGLNAYESLENNKASQVKMQLLISCNKYSDSLTARLNMLNEELKDTGYKADKKQAIANYRSQIASEIENFNKERNAFISTDVHPKSDFKNEKERVEAELKNVQSLLLKANGHS